MFPLMSPPGFVGEILSPVASTALLSPFSDKFRPILSDFGERGVGGVQWVSVGFLIFGQHWADFV